MASFLHSISQMNQSGESASGMSTTSASATKIFRQSVQVGKNIGKVRWLEAQSPLLVPDPLATEQFVIGSCGYLEENEVSLWQLSVHGSRDDQKFDIQLLHKYPINGNVTEVVSLDNESFALTTSHGAISVFKVIQTQPIEDCALEDTLTQIRLAFSKKLHSFRKGNSLCPATGISVSGTSAVTVGEDGSIYELSLANNEIVQCLDFVDPLSLCTVKYVGRSSVATGNGGGQVKIWDLRVSTPRAPVQTMNHLNELTGAISIAQHPTQSHVLLVGYESGSMDLWDIRQGSITEPTANLPSEEGAISEIYFHGLDPDNFFTCSQNGEMNHWFPPEADGYTDMVQNNDYDIDLNIEFLKHGLSCKNLHSSSFPLNSMNLSRNNRLICGGDSGIVYSSELIL